ncbi:type IV toxin-antitoxin system AbiEi family antitoxin domain-containing protein [Salinibacterium sp. SYSU T00001]|uniref:type IV toxin-antitoxin system AbiEi family antitoxin domain-containing protein n=1 Tax=Homoserinimonas sedimenticola TaxID=2986805 RepID=UPI00223546D4|nr:type IV toxin-antitoxin system AbiEi family antitoxin domain-containing protein [Salinibacterium sedimenticola]MCW4386015.1 type IV toxin-antitoxin system AbiEi family antitoxin domain-containing protein [Salinibacterium sedimenticola]
MSPLVGSESLILSTDLRRAGRPDDQLIRAAHRGELVRLRRGAYCDVSEWAAMSDRERHVLRMRAVAAAAEAPLVFCGPSAAALWGMPSLDGFPREVHVLSEPASGGRSRNGVRRHPLTGSVPPVEEREGLLVTSLARTAVDVVRLSSFAEAVGCLDWALWRRNPHRVTQEEVRRELERSGIRYGVRHSNAVLDFGTHLSDSFGESMGRAVSHELGFPTPVLQARFVDAQGEMFTDYHWPDEGVIGEFDGVGKYLRDSGGRDPGAVVVAEKKREDRLRRMPGVTAVARIIWREVRNPRELDVLLRDTGLRAIRRR